MEINNSSNNIDHNARNAKNIKGLKPIHFLIIFVAISTIFAFILGGYFIGKEKKQEKQNAETEISEQIKIDVTELPNNPEKWTEYELYTLGIKLKLPETLTELGEWSETGEAFICFSNENTDEICKNENLIISSTKNEIDINNFQATKGYEQNGNTINVISPNRETKELNNSKFKEFDDGNFEILKILGDENAFTPDANYLGAIVNTNNTTYPAIILQMNINGDLQEFEFDQILASIKKL